MTFDAQGGTTPSPTAKSVTYGATYGTLATTARAGYAFAGSLQRAGYATDPDYAAKLTRVINTALRLQRAAG